MYYNQKSQISVVNSLPVELEYFIFQVLGGKYETKQNVDDNLDNDEKKNLLYLGTYFPRSYAESYKISDNLFKNNIIKYKYSSSTEISILDIGSGTGGNLMGLLYAVKNNLPSVKSVNILSIDGNDIALGIQKKIINHCHQMLNLSINIEYRKQIFLPQNLFAELTNIISNSSFSKFDIVMSWKFINEFYNKVITNACELYKSFLIFTEKYLTDKGLSILLDVTSQDKYKKRTYLPIIITNETVSFLKSNQNKLKILLPLSCAYNYKECKNNNCFSQNIFIIRHQKAALDVSKFCTFVFGKPQFVDEILKNEKKENSYITCYKYNSSITYPDGCCMNGMNIRGLSQHLNKNAFKLNN